MILLSVGVSGVVTFATAQAHADLAEEAARVEGEWRRAGSVVQRAEPRFVLEGEGMSIDIPLPESARRAPSSADGDADRPGCLTVAFVAARGLSFHARTDDASDDPLSTAAGASDPGRASSVAGLLVLERCGDPFARLDISVDAGRGTIETLIARSPRPLPPIATVLPERVGTLAPPGLDLGPLPPLPALGKRLDAAEARARRDSAQVAARTKLAAETDGTGQTQIALAAGCFRLELFSSDPPTTHAGHLDIDAELRDADSDDVLARDRTDAPDARLDACVGAPTRANLAFAGSPPHAEIVLTRASWPIPTHLPVAWGPSPRAGLASALRRRHLASPAEDPVFLAQGGSGGAPVWADLEPGACYLAEAGVVRGRSHGIGLRVRIGAREVRDERSASESASAVAFCAGGTDGAVFDVDARGSGVGWGLALYRLESAVWSGR